MYHAQIFVQIFGSASDFGSGIWIIQILGSRPYKIGRDFPDSGIQIGGSIGLDGLDHPGRVANVPAATSGNTLQCLASACLQQSTIHCNTFALTPTSICNTTNAFPPVLLLVLTAGLNVVQASASEWLPFTAHLLSSLAGRSVRRVVIGGGQLDDLGTGRPSALSRSS